MIPTPIVFIVDDDAFIRSLLTRLFGEAGMLVQSFASGAEFIANADLRSRALLLLDMKMPGISGLELQIMLRDRNVRLPIIFLTGVSDVPMAVAAMQNGAFDFIEKPFDGSALIERVSRAYVKYFDVAASSEGVMLSDYLARLKTLTPREREVLDLMVTGASSKVIARELGSSFRTVEIHRGRVMFKMAATHLARLVRMNQAFAPPSETLRER